MKRRYKLFAVDLDGTLLDRHGEVHAVDADALRAMAERGVIITIVTGRLYSGTKPAARVVGIEGPVACVDGVHIVDASTDRELFHEPLPGEDAAIVRETIEAHGAACFVFAHDEIVHDDHGEAFLPYVQLWSRRLSRHHRATRHPHWHHPKGVSEVVCVGSPQAISDTRDDLHRRLGARVNVVAFPIVRMLLGEEPRWGMIVRTAKHDKGSAVRWLAAHHNVSLEEVVTVGDWLNDVPMFDISGRSFAMGQAPDEVKARATDQLEASSERGGGIREAARRSGLLP